MKYIARAVFPAVLFALFLALSPSNAAAQGRHPAYLHALSDLRAARAHLERSDHGELRPRSSARSVVRTALQMAASGARRFIQSSHWATPCARNISTPETVAMRFFAASFKSCVLSGR